MATTINVDRVLNKWSDIVIKKIIKTLLSANKSASGALINSLDAKWNKNNGLYSFTLIGNKTLQYVNDGRKPYGRGAVVHNKRGVFQINNRFPNIKAIEQWIRIKNIPIRPLKDGTIPTRKQQVYLIARGIAIRGIKPLPILKDATNTISKSSAFLNEIKTAAVKDLRINMNIVIKSVNSGQPTWGFK
jgi:hypothetical protein